MPEPGRPKKQSDKPGEPGDESVLKDRDILEAVAMGVMALGPNGRIRYLNRAAARICQIETEDALGRSCRDVLNSSLCMDECPLRAALTSREVQYNRDAVFIRQDGRSVLPVKVTVTPAGKGQARGAVMTIQSYQLAQILESQKGYGWEDFVGESPQIRRIFEVLKVVVNSPATILIEGTTGTGKDLLANIIHQNSPRMNKPFVKVNCAALPENLLESEMFGYVRGAFTGAERNKPGRFQMAHKGTIFLDEISEMPLPLQAKLLRVIEDREFFALGDSKTTKVDVRVIAACNKPLSDQVRAGLFREDLFYRLNVIRVHIPPLNERREDLPLLIRRIIQKKNLEHGGYICKLSEGVLQTLLNHEFPGNVRELENILEHACLLCQGETIREKHLPLSLLDLSSRPCPAPSVGVDQKSLIIQALIQADWNRSQAAKALGIDRSTLWRRMKKLGIEAP